MKKFLSLVLALIMAMSLVTVSAGATEYKDLTDKDEIQYEEAVAVLNRIGVITGYEDGSFRPETELTRGAAAKIIVSLLIGPEAASNLPNTYAPYPDVPANHTFAGVISYCKTAGIISGYGDGTFKPANSLTGYAFAKMLLGAIGYDSKIQGYTDTGWTMNVARDGNKAGLFNRIEFDGAAAVNREQACQLALNTLKATMVEYSGGLSVTAGDAHVTANPTLSYKISNQSYARNISNRKSTDVGNADMNNHWTVEFGEEHFKDLRLNDEHGSTSNMARDAFGRPSNVWSFKKVTIGTFPIEPDFVYTTQVIHTDKDDEKVTDASKVRALELNGYELTRDGQTAPSTALYENGAIQATPAKVADIADWTDNGTRVEVYVDEDDADYINTVVVVKTQLMEIKSIKSDAVSLKLYDDASDADGARLVGYNQAPIDEKVNDVEVNDDWFKTLSGMKEGDIVAVVPVWVADNSKYDVAKVYAPETVSGELTWVDTYGKSGKVASAVNVTVGGTDYKVALWNKDLYDIDGTSIRVTRKDVTLYLDEFGNALLAKNVGSTADYMVIGGYHSGLVDGKVVTYADGWDIKGNELSLNIGNIQYDNNNLQGNVSGIYPIGSLVRYASSSSSKYAEWKLSTVGVFNVASQRRASDAEGTEAYKLNASSSKVLLNDYLAGTGFNSTGGVKDKDGVEGKPVYGTPGYDTALTENVFVDDGGIKVIYLTMGDDGEVDSIEVKNGMQSISNDEILGKDARFATSVLRAQACVGLKDGLVNAESAVKAIVVKRESNSANLTDLVYITRYLGSAGKAPGADNTQRPVYGYEVHFVGTDDWDDEVTIYSHNSGLGKGDFARARKSATVPEGVKNVTEDNFYILTGYGTNQNQKTKATLSVMQSGTIERLIAGNKTLMKVMNYAPSDVNFKTTWTPDKDLDLGDESVANVLSLRGAKYIDLTKRDIRNATELKDELAELAKDGETLTIQALYNDNTGSDGFRDVYVLVITGTAAALPAPKTWTVKVEGTGIDSVADKTVNDGESATITIKAAAGKVITGVTAPAGVTITTVPADLSGKTAGSVTVTVEKVTSNVTLTVTTEDGTAQAPAKVTLNGSAGKDNHFSVTGQAADGTAPDGKITINALKDIVVYVDGAGREEIAKGGKKEISVTADTAVTVNKYKWEASGTTLTRVEDTTAAQTEMETSSVQSAAANAAPQYVFVTVAGTTVKKIAKLGTNDKGQMTLTFASAADVAAVVAALEEMDKPGVDPEPEVSDDEPTEEEIKAIWGDAPVTADETVKAVLAGGKYSIYTYKAEAADQAKAIAAVLAAYNKASEGGTATFSETNYNAETGKLTFKVTNNGTTAAGPELTIVTGTAKDSGSIAAPKALYKVTVGTAASYVKAGDKITSVTKGTYVSDATPYVPAAELTKWATAGSTGLEFKAGTVAEGSYDVTLVQAVPATGGLDVGASYTEGRVANQAKLSYNGKEQTIMSLAKTDLVAVGSDLTLYVYVAAKSTTALLVNGTRSEAKNETEANGPVEFPVKVTLKDDAFAITADTKFQIKVNGELMSNTDGTAWFASAPSALALPGSSSSWTGMTLAQFTADTTDNTMIHKEGFSVYGGRPATASITVGAVAATANISTLAATNGVLELYSGYTIGAPASDFVISNTQSGTGTGSVKIESGTTNGGFVTCRPGGTTVDLYLIAKKANTVAAKAAAAAATITDFKEVVAPVYERVGSTEAESKTVKGVYSFKVKGAVTYGTEFQATEYTAPSVSSYTKGGTVNLGDLTSTKFALAEVTYTYAPESGDEAFEAVSTETAFGGTLTSPAVTLKGDDETSNATAKCGVMTITAKHGNIVFKLTQNIMTTGDD